MSTQWSDIDLGEVAPLRPNYGAAAQAVDQGIAFYFNGQLDSGSSKNLGIPNVTQVFLSGTVVINTTDQTARNLSTAQVSPDLARAGGEMQYLPEVGEKGALVLIGGTNNPSNQFSSTNTAAENLV